VHISTGLPISSFHYRILVHYKLPGVLWLMIGLLVLQIVVVWAWGVEPRNRVLEDVAVASA
jgi:MFS transporter, putative metabolite:H+ symporter